MSLRHLVLATAALAAVTSAPRAAKNPMVAGAAMYPTRTIVENAANSKDVMQSNGVIHVIDRVLMP